jgi:hypothetical protein
MLDLHYGLLGRGYFCNNLSGQNSLAVVRVVAVFLADVPHAVALDMPEPIVSYHSPHI